MSCRVCHSRAFADRTTDADNNLPGRQIDLFYDHPHGDNTPAAPSSPRSQSGAFYSTAGDARHTILRLKDGMDTSQPSTNGTSVSNLFRLGEMLGDDTYEYLARETIHAFEVETLQHPWLFPSLLSGVVTARKLGRRLDVAWRTPEADATAADFFTTPRAGLKSRIYLTETRDSWIETRMPKSQRDLFGRGRDAVPG